MKTLALRTTLALALLPTPVLAQHVLFEEDFENGIPATWTHIQRSFSLDVWTPGFRFVDGSRDVNHEWFCHNGFTMRNNLLLSPPLDLSGVTSAYFECGQWQTFPLARFYNGIEITTNGGASLTAIYQETGTWSGFGTIKADMSAWAGQTNVQIVLHYRGVVANDWSIDNVRVTTSPVAHAVTNLVQGQTATFSVSRGVPGNTVFMILSIAGAGPLPTSWGNINLTPPLLFFAGRSIDAAGNAGASLLVPGGTAGITVYSQAIEFSLPGTVNITNPLATTIQ